ncbi:MAG: low molecular weight protein-tyrosine-phosphatase [Eubacteriales bacterium]|nr:low molecular weight protein-tyrosine-phosphatase [Eubacteriales bacterium]
MIKILFVCQGNICRSPMAEFVFSDMVNKRGLSDQFHIESAATSMEEIGNGVHYGTRNKLRREGVPMWDHRARQITRGDYDRFDYILGMEQWNLRNIKRIIGADPEKKVHLLLDYSKSPRDIADPWYTGNFDVTYDDIVEGCEGLLAHILSEM